MDLVERQRLPVQLRPLARALEFPGRHVGEIGVVAQGLALGCLALLAEVAAA